MKSNLSARSEKEGMIIRTKEQTHRSRTRHRNQGVGSPAVGRCGKLNKRLARDKVLDNGERGARCLRVETHLESAERVCGRVAEGSGVGPRHRSSPNNRLEQENDGVGNREIGGDTIPNVVLVEVYDEEGDRRGRSRNGAESDQVRNPSEIKAQSTYCLRLTIPNTAGHSHFLEREGQCSDLISDPRSAARQ